mmetsp:Transcript_12572/g.46984  ORF Transcript_12572/g.46984 Transcript_12572/m.46984 type:complete len:342 (+) Transcript_12572:1528-2553(+)
MAIAAVAATAASRWSAASRDASANSRSRASAVAAAAAARFSASARRSRHAMSLASILRRLSNRRVSKSRSRVLESSLTSSWCALDVLVASRAASSAASRSTRAAFSSFSNACAARTAASRVFSSSSFVARCVSLSVTCAFSKSSRAVVSAVSFSRQVVSLVSASNRSDSMSLSNARARFVSVSATASSSTRRAAKTALSLVLRCSSRRVPSASSRDAWASQSWTASFSRHAVSDLTLSSCCSAALASRVACLCSPAAIEQRRVSISPLSTSSCSAVLEVVARSTRRLARNSFSAANFAALIASRSAAAAEARSRQASTASEPTPPIGPDGGTDMASRARSA